MPTPNNNRVQRVALELRNNLATFFGMTRGHSEIILDGPAGTGKALTLDTQVPTLSGWKTMGTVQVGDHVFDQDGKPTKVVGKSPVMENHPVFRVGFSDGSWVKADGEHLWEVLDVYSSPKPWRKRRSGKQYVTKVLTTEELDRTSRNRSKYAVVCSQEVRYNDRPLLIDPYVLGCWLGDGDSRDCVYTCADPEIIGYIRQKNYPVKSSNTDPIRYRILGNLLEELRSYGLLESKHIPQEYLQSHISDRYELLRGLMDTNGTACLRQGTCEFCNTSEALAEGVYELVCSLGIKATLNSGVATLYGKDCGPKYRVCFTTDKPVFKLKRKMAHLPKTLRSTQHRRYVTSVIPIGTEPVCCIKVDSDRGLFLITKSFIPTHNTRVLLERQHLIMNKYPRARGLVVRKFRASMNETVLEVLDNEVFKNADGELYPDAPKWHERDQKYVYDNESEIIVCGMDDPTKVMSSKYDWFYWNEAIEAKRSEWEAILSRLRNFKIPFQQGLGDTNPGPPTHWINQMALAGKLKRLPTTHKDNPVYWDDVKNCWTDKGEMYVNKVLRDSLTGLRYKRLYEGKWVAAEGQVYPMWDPKIHMIPRRPIPNSWTRYWAFDFGYIDPFVWQEWVENPDTGQMILHRELYHTQMRVAEAAALIRERSFGIVPYALICDHDSENRATLEKELGFFTLPAFKSIHVGVQGTQVRLKPDKKWSSGNNEIPGLVIMENANIKTDSDLLYRHKPTCTAEEWEGYVWNTTKIAQDKYKDEPIDKDNHGMDTARYAVAFVDSLSIDPQEREDVMHYNDLDEDELEEHWRDTAISSF